MTVTVFDAHYIYLKTQEQYQRLSKHLRYNQYQND